MEAISEKRTKARRWRRTPPNMDGWWKFKEDGMSSIQSILVSGRSVADDGEWEDATGRKPSDYKGENYWEMSSTADMTNGTLTSGLWMFDRKA